MSYILNALKKAEHDRKREEPEDLDDFVSAGWDPYQETPKSIAGYKWAIIIVAISTLLFVGFYSLNSGPQQSVEVLETEAVTEQVVEQVVEQISEKGAEQPVTIENQSVIQEFVKEPVAEELLVEDLQLPEVTIAGHIYIRSGSAKNRIFIGEQTYYVGDTIDGDWVIESINFDSLGIRSGAFSSELPLR